MNNFQNRIEKLITYLVLGILLSAGIFIVLTIGSQAITWLKTGVIPPRDLFWLTAPVHCPESWQGGFEGMDICRQDYIQFTEMVGLNKIINFLMGIHVAIIAFFVAILASLFLTSFFNKIQNAAARKTREQRKEDKR